MEYRIDEMQKIIRKKLGSKEKMGHFWWIASFIESNGEDAV